MSGEERRKVTWKSLDLTGISKLLPRNPSHLPFLQIFKPPDAYASMTILVKLDSTTSLPSVTSWTSAYYSRLTSWRIRRLYLYRLSLRLIVITESHLEATPYRMHQQTAWLIVLKSSLLIFSITIRVRFISYAFSGKLAPVFLKGCDSFIWRILQILERHVRPKWHGHVTTYRNAWPFLARVIWSWRRLIEPHSVRKLAVCTFATVARWYSFILSATAST